MSGYHILAIIKRAFRAVLVAAFGVFLAAAGACKNNEASTPMVRQERDAPTNSNSQAAVSPFVAVQPSPTPVVESNNQPQRKIEVVETTLESGLPQSREEGYYDADGNFILHGATITYYEGGEKKTEIYYRDNVLHGSRTVWRRDGKLWTQGDYYDGKPHGKWMQWFQDGKPALEMSFEYGKYHGTFIDYHTNGQKRKQTEWVDGKEVSVRVWDETGRELFVVPEKEKSASKGGH